MGLLTRLTLFLSVEKALGTKKPSQAKRCSYVPMFLSIYIYIYILVVWYSGDTHGGCAGNSLESMGTLGTWEQAVS